MDGIKQINLSEMAGEKREMHEGYGYVKRDFVPIREARGCAVAVYELLPGRSAYPYHYHAVNEEVFYVISGHGALKTPDGERAVRAGDLIFFPSGERGAHKLTNTSDTDNLVYVDFDTHNAVDVAIYPDSHKLGVWGAGINKAFRTKDAVGYFDGE